MYSILDDITVPIYENCLIVDSEIADPNSAFVGLSGIQDLRLWVLPMDGSTSFLLDIRLLLKTGSMSIRNPDFYPL